MAIFTNNKVVLKYRPNKRWISKAFKNFKAAFDFATKKNLSEFEIDSVRYFNI